MVTSPTSPRPRAIDWRASPPAGARGRAATVGRGRLHAGRRPGLLRPRVRGPAPNTEFQGQVETVGDAFWHFFNEQVPKPDGSLTVYAAHLDLLGPSAVGDVYIGRVDCGVTAIRTATTLGIARRRRQPSGPRPQRWPVAPLLSRVARRPRWPVARPRSGARPPRRPSVPPVLRQSRRRRVGRAAGPHRVDVSVACRPLVPVAGCGQPGPDRTRSGHAAASGSRTSP